MGTKFKAVALDLDGTTLNDLHELTDRTLQVLRQLSDKGVLVTLATGRTTASAISYAVKMKLSQPFIPLITFNGAYGCVYDQSLKTVTTIYSEPLPENSVRELVKMAEEFGLVLQYYNALTGDVYAVPLNDSHKRLLKRYADLTAREQVILSSYEEAIAQCSSQKVLILSDDQEFIVEESKKRFPEGMFHVIKGSPHSYFVEFLCPGVNKGTSLSQVMNYFGIQLQNVISFGDGDNDKEMLYECGLGVAMSNARMVTKEHANVVLEYSNHEDGVAICLENYLKEGKFD